MSLQRGTFALIALALVAGLVPAGFVLNSLLSAELVERAREDLAVAPRLLADREAMRADAMVMHARDLAGSRALSGAIERQDRLAAARIARDMAAPFGEEPLLVVGEDEVWLGSHPGDSLVRATREGRTPVDLHPSRHVLRRIAVAPVTRDGVWLAAAGVSVPLDRSAAGTLAGLTRSEVVFLLGDGTISATTADEGVTAAIRARTADWAPDGSVREIVTGDGNRYLLVVAPLGTAGKAVFARDLEAELAVLPQLRRVAALAGISALVLALVLGAVFSALLSRPVRSLAHAADRLAAGDFEAPIEHSAIQEVDRVGRAFDDMRRALAARLEELEVANRELAERQRRLAALQAELIQKDRLAATGRLVTELAHEVRNPVANVRNCLEVIRRRVEGDRTAREFADLAIDELLRMHELAERMLDIHRPRDPSVVECDAAEITREVTALVRAGARHRPIEIGVEVPSSAPARIPPDALKQVLLNLVQNAREANRDEGRIELAVSNRDSEVVIEVADDGPGISDDVLPQIFDPFFTTKGTVQGVGLGLFVAEGIVRRHGGRISASNQPEGGALFRIELMSASETPVDEEAATAPSRPEGDEARGERERE